MELTLELRHEIETNAKRMMECLSAVFLLAGIEVKRTHRLPNGYCGSLCCAHRPWMLAETKYGNIKIGWRKRVLSIEWTNDVVNVHGKTVLSIGDENVTNWETGVHAWGYAKAIEQLGKFAELANRFISNKEEDARLTAPELEEYNRLTKEYQESIQNRMLPPFSQSNHERLQELRRKRHG